MKWPSLCVQTARKMKAQLVAFVALVLIMQAHNSYARSRVKDPRILCISCADKDAVDADDTGSCSSAAVDACDHVRGAMSSMRMGSQQRSIDMNAYVSGSEFRQLWETAAGYDIHHLDVWLCLSTNTEGGAVKCEGWANFSTWTVYDAYEHVYADMDDWLCTMRYLWVPSFVSSKTGGRIKAGQLIELPSDSQCDVDL